MITIYDTLKCTISNEIQNYKYKCTKSLFDLEQNRIFVNSFNETNQEIQHQARLIDIESNAFLMYYPGPKAQITSLCCTPKILFTSSKDTLIRLHDISNGQTLATFSLAHVSTDIALHPNGFCLAAANAEKIALL